MFKWARNSSSQKFTTQKMVPFDNVHINTNIIYIYKKEKMISGSGSESSQAT